MESVRIKVLLVDDDEDDYVMTRDLLAEVGDGGAFALDWVTTYAEGLAAIGRREHDVYLLDYRLGEQDGLGLLREAIESGCKAPMILVTGQGDLEVDLEAMKAGAADYLVKSDVDAPLLERSIRYAIERNRMDQLKDDLIAFVSHELRTPLAAVKGYAQTLLSEDEGDAEELAKELLGNIVDSAEQLTRRIDAFLDVSKIDAGHGIDLVRHDFDVRDVVDEAIGIQRAAAARCPLETHCGEHVGTVRADRDKVLQVLANLLSNADKYSPDRGAIQVRVTVGEGEMRFAVVDQGIGIPEEALEDLFAPFYRVRDPERRKIRGTGLGLHICKLLVEAHGGRIWIDSSPGEGTRCCFTIPT
ncbi:MAG: ATP-binding protein [Armatimonadota bacterium]|jgi:signal transduction histidine kinase